MLTSSLPHLLSEADRGRLAIFIGAGVPRALTGLPAIDDLAHDLGQTLHLDTPSDPSFFTITQAAGRIHYGQVIQFLRDRLNTTGLDPQPFDRLLARLPVNYLVTTRYDNLLDKAFDQLSRLRNTIVTDADVGIMRHDRATLVKLYGDLNQPGSLLITQDALFTLVADKPRVLRLVEQTLSGTVLFLGYDLDSPDFLNLWLNVIRQGGQFAPVAYATSDVATSTADQELWRGRNIQLLADSPLALLNALADQLLLVGPEVTSRPPGSPPPHIPEPPVSRYRNFDLQLAYSAAGDLTARILRSPAGEDTATPEVLHDLPPTLDGVSTLAGVDAAIGTQLLPGTVGAAWSANLSLAALATEGLRLRLFIEDEELAAVPWEAASVNGSRLALNPLTPVVRYVAAPRPADVVLPELPLRLLVMLSSATDPGLPALDIPAEQAALEAALEPLVTRGKVHVYWLSSPLTRANFLDVLRRQQPHLLHFIGHGAYDVDTATGGLLIDDPETDNGLDWLTTEELGLMVTGSSLRFALLNACQSGRAAGGVAQGLVRASLPAALGMQANIPDDAAVAFAGAFYRALADGWPLDAAAVEGRRLLALETGLDAPWWALPVLYMRAGHGQLFES